ncbi:MAG: HAD-IA family hydrolase [Pseudomonadota bacterium]
MTLIIFDMDGTLIDSQANIVGGMVDAYAAVDLPAPDRDKVLSIVGLSLPEAFFRLEPSADQATRHRMVEAYKSGFAGRRSGPLAPMYPGAAALLETLAASNAHDLAIATGKSRRGLNHELAAHGLTGLFSSTQVADDHPSKPHPSMIERILVETAQVPENAVMIGDTTYDIQMGRAAGTRTIGVTWGYHAQSALVASGADHIVSSYGDLGNLLLDEFP